MAILPRKITSLKTKKKGFTLTEVLIVVAIILILLLIAIWAYRLQLLKGRDARRKADLNRLEKVFEDYYNDHDCYPENPGDLIPDYLNEFPKDPVTREPYEWSTDDCDVYRIYAKLDWEQDPAIAEAGCSSGCGPGAGTSGGICNYNYGVCSSNAELESCGLGPNACQGGICSKLIYCNGVTTKCWKCDYTFWDVYCGGSKENPQGFCNPEIYGTTYHCEKID